MMKTQIDDQGKNREDSSGTVLTGQEKSESSGRPNDGANGDSSKREKMVTSALIASIILALIAVAVAGVFQVTSHFLQTCPRELPVNDPAPKLWSDITSQKTVTAPLGVSDKLLKEAAFKAQVSSSN